MSEEEYNDFLGKIDWEGFDYCFTDYSSWSEIKDKEFQKLRKAYVKARKAFADYVDPDGEVH
jgi:hypothetical protein